MIYNKSHWHRVKLVGWSEVDMTLQNLHENKVDILAIGPAGLGAYIHYREKCSDYDSAIKRAQVPQRDLNALYVLYPRKAGKKPGLAKLAKLIKSDDDYANVQQAILNFDKHCKGRANKFIPYFSTFVNNYLDDFMPENYTDETAGRYEFLNG